MWPNLTARATFSDKQIEDRVRDILSQVRERGDDALRSLAEQIDGVRLDSLQVTEQEIERARGNVSEEPLKRPYARP
ncbi:MAG: histidinol dehydrogenase [Alistipes putredinis]|nr:MAG: histidinol dehydrogenase [Alistipes putredinis]